MGCPRTPRAEKRCGRFRVAGTSLAIVLTESSALFRLRAVAVSFGSGAVEDPKARLGS